MATLPTTLEPTGHYPAHGPRVQQTRGAGGLSGGRCIRFGSGPVQGPHDRDGRYHCLTKVDVIVVLHRAAWPTANSYIADKFGKVVLSSPRFGVTELKKALERGHHLKGNKSRVTRPAQEDIF